MSLLSKLQTKKKLSTAKRAFFVNYLLVCSIKKTSDSMSGLWHLAQQLLSFRYHVIYRKAKILHTDWARSGSTKGVNADRTTLTAGIFAPAKASTCFH